MTFFQTFSYKYYSKNFHFFTNLFNVVSKNTSKCKFFVTNVLNFFLNKYLRPESSSNKKLHLPDGFVNKCTSKYGSTSHFNFWMWRRGFEYGSQNPETFSNCEGFDNGKDIIISGIARDHYFENRKNHNWICKPRKPEN